MIRPLLPGPALAITNERILVVADLHLGYEYSLADKGIHLPSQTTKIQNRLLQIIDEYSPRSLIILGDVKQAIPRISLEEWKDVPEFFEAIASTVGDIQVILGNHDGDLEPLTPPSIKILPASGVVVGRKLRIGLFHGHAWPSPKVLSSDIMVMGHIHPVVRFRDKIGLRSVRQAWVRVPLDGMKLREAHLKYIRSRSLKERLEALENLPLDKNKNPKLIIMPAFNDILGGLPVNRLETNLMGPILRSGSLNLKSAEVYLLDGTFLGKNRDVYDLDSLPQPKESHE